MQISGMNWHGQKKALFLDQNNATNDGKECVVQARLFVGINYEESIENSVTDAINLNYEVNLIRHGIIDY